MLSLRRAGHPVLATSGAGHVGAQGSWTGNVDHGLGKIVLSVEICVGWAIAPNLYSSYAFCQMFSASTCSTVLSPCVLDGLFLGSNWVMEAMRQVLDGELDDRSGGCPLQCGYCCSPALSQVMTDQVDYFDKHPYI